jgi:hypothetical protein
VLEFIEVCVCRHWKILCEIPAQHNIVRDGIMKFNTYKHKVGKLEINKFNLHGERQTRARRK